QYGEDDAAKGDAREAYEGSKYHCPLAFVRLAAQRSHFRHMWTDVLHGYPRQSREIRPKVMPMATTQTREAEVLESVPKQLLIGGEWRDAGEGGTLAVEDPATGDALCEVADARPDDAKAALDAAV